MLLRQKLKLPVKLAALQLALALLAPGTDQLTLGQPHPALAHHSRALSQIAAVGSPQDAVADRQRLWGSLRSHAYRRGRRAAVDEGAIVGAGTAASQGLPAHVSTRVRSSSPGDAPPGSAGVINPIAFGADPTGRKDSTQASRSIQSPKSSLARERASGVSSALTHGLDGPRSSGCSALAAWVLTSPIIIHRYVSKVSGGVLFETLRRACWVAQLVARAGHG